jgi:hypothetical protein
VPEEQAGTGEDLGFDDPFFTTEDPEKTTTKSAIRKEERRKKREAREAEEKEKSAERAKLELLMEDDADAAAAGASSGPGAKGMSHFDMAEILKEEKRKGKKLKGKKAKKQAAKDAESSSKNLLQEGFEMDVDDERFKAVFEDHEYAIDPSNPRFKPTSAMKKLLEKGRSKRRRGDEEEGDAEGEGPSKGSKKARADSGELAGLVESVKRKSKKN